MLGLIAVHVIKVMESLLSFARPTAV